MVSDLTIVIGAVTIMLLITITWGVVQNEESKRKDQERKVAELRSSPPYRYYDDVERILRSGISDNKLEFYEYPYDYDISVRLKNYPSPGQKEEVLRLKLENVRNLTTPIVYRPQGAEKWEDYLIWLSEQKGMTIDEEEKKREASRHEIWQHNHSPLP